MLPTVGTDQTFVVYERVRGFRQWYYDLHVCVHANSLIPEKPPSFLSKCDDAPLISRAEYPSGMDARPISR